MSIEALLTKIVEQNTKLIDALTTSQATVERQSGIILELVTQLSEQMDDEGKGSGSLDGG